MRRYAPIPLLPVVIDSPNQQAQDQHSLSQILHFIRDHVPEDMQLVLGREETMRVDFGGETIVLQDRLRLLQAYEYEDVAAEIALLLRDALHLMEALKL